MRKLLQLTAILLALSLTACAPSNAPASSSEPPAPESSAPAPAQPEASEPETSKEAVSEESEETETLNLTERQDWTFSADLTDVDIEMDLGGLTVEPGDAFALTAENFNPDWLTVEEQDGTLRLVYHKPESDQQDDRTWEEKAAEKEENHHQFLLTLPEGHQVDEFSMHAGVGSLLLRQLAFPELDLSTGTGYFLLEDVSSETFELGCGTGEVKGKNLAVTRETDLSLGTGEVSLSGDLSGEIEADSGTGEIELYLRQPRDAYVLSGRVSPAGSIQVDGAPFSGSDAAAGGKHSLRVGGGTTEISLWFDSEGPEA